MKVDDDLFLRERAFRDSSLKQLLDLGASLKDLTNSASRRVTLTGIFPRILGLSCRLATDPSKMTGFATALTSFVEGRTLGFLRTMPFVSTTITNR